MNIKDFIFGSKDGMDCQENSDGSLTCRKFQINKNSKIATGSEATISLESNTCRTFFSGRFSVLEEDEDDFQRIAKKRESACKGGLL